MKKIKIIIKKVCTKETLLYIAFGIFTTIVNIGVSNILVKKFNIEGNLASTIGIILAIIFAYFTNRKIVFDSQAKTLKEKGIEFLKFILGRAFTMILEIVGVFILYSVIGVEYIITKFVMTIIVVIVNFFISKYYSFKH